MSLFLHLCVVCAVNFSLKLYFSLLAAATYLNLVLSQSGPFREFVNEQGSSVAATATLNPSSSPHSLIVSSCLSSVLLVLVGTVFDLGSKA